MCYFTAHALPLVRAYNALSLFLSSLISQVGHEASACRRSRFSWWMCPQFGGAVFSCFVVLPKLMYSLFVLASDTTPGYEVRLVSDFAFVFAS